MTTPKSNMHCKNPQCVDDDCRGECEEKKEDCGYASCGCREATDDLIVKTEKKQCN